MSNHEFKPGDAVKIAPETASFRNGFTHGKVASISPCGLVTVRCGKNPKRTRAFFKGHLKRMDKMK